MKLASDQPVQERQRAVGGEIIGMVMWQAALASATVTTTWCCLNCLLLRRVEMLFYFENDGPELLSTNYWDSEHAEKGFVYVTINAGCFRLLVPKGKGLSLDEMRTAEVVLITRGPWKEQGKHDGLEVLFEDNSDSPYFLRLVPEQVSAFPKYSDRDRPGQEPKWNFAVYNQDGKQFECKAHFRKAKSIPYMKAWRG